MVWWTAVAASNSGLFGHVKLGTGWNASQKKERENPSPFWLREARSRAEVE